MSVDSGDGQWSLVPQLRGDDPQELAYLYDNYAAYIFDYCEEVLRDTDDAADAVRDTLVAAYASVGALADQDRLRSWLYAIARRQWPAYLQRPETAVTLAADDDQLAAGQSDPDVAAGPDFPADQRTSANQLAAADQPAAGDQQAAADQLAAADHPEAAGQLAAADQADGDWAGAADQPEAGDQHGAASQQRAGEHPYPPVAARGEAAAGRQAGPAAHPLPGDPAGQAPPAPPGGPAGQSRTADLAREVAAAQAAAENGQAPTAAEDVLARAQDAAAEDAMADDGVTDESELAGYDTDEFDALTPAEEELQEREARERETMTVVAAAFDGLAGPDREVLNLAYRHGIIGTDLAVTIGLADRQVRARLTEAVSRFSQAADVIIILYLGWTRCRALEQIAGDWDPASSRLDPELLAALTRHAARCQRCRHSSGYTVYGPDLLASIPLTMPPDDLRQQVIATAHDAGLDEYRAEVVGRLGALDPDGFPLPAGRRRHGSRAPGPAAPRPARRQGRRRVPLAAAVICAVAAAVVVAGFLVFRLVTTSGPAPDQPAVPLQAVDASPGSQLTGSGQATPSDRRTGPAPRSSTGLPPGLLGPTQPGFTPVPPEPQPTQEPSPHRSPSPGTSKSPQPSPTVPKPPPTSSPSPTPTPTPTSSAAPPG